MLIGILGRIVDCDSGQGIANATITSSLHKNQATADEYGFYQLVEGQTTKYIGSFSDSYTQVKFTVTAQGYDGLETSLKLPPIALNAKHLDDMCLSVES